MKSLDRDVKAKGSDDVERIEGWGSLSNAPSAHYFREGRSLCGRWMSWGPPRWEDYQERGPEPKPRSDTCKACWRKAPEVAPSSVPSAKENDLGRGSTPE